MTLIELLENKELKSFLLNKGFEQCEWGFEFTPSYNSENRTTIMVGFCENRGEVIIYDFDESNGCETQVDSPQDIIGSVNISLR